ncbi:hypothetical protein QNI19_38660 [Cytophagaceae bacterium DM2B3-1]|uniref:Uncharacterized protein n=1 Tax=Xanthocytophaga flava TaxID=3048013 RepID=A0ABT7CYQ6_9BACT|nr:hypothetical protein [Xanthocytophaga flavus]MDJ1498914.1 hypothetical protein [Xanthocytophaga flavus]
MKSNQSSLARRAYKVQGAHTFIGVFGSGSSACCRVVTILDNYVSYEVLTVSACKERFAIDNELGLIHEIKVYEFTNAETKATKKLMRLFQIQYSMNLLEPARVAEREKETGARVIPLWPEGKKPAA